MPLFETEGARLFYEEAGSGPAIVFAHGGGGDTSQWRHQTPVFAQRYRVITFDARGHGRSPAPASDYGMAAFCEDIAALLRHLDVRQAHLVGATLGAVAMLECALAHPGVARTLVLISTAPDTTDEMRARFEASAAVVEAGDLRAFAEGFVNFLFSPQYVAGHAAEVADFRKRLERIDPAAYARSIRALGHRPDLSPRLKALRVPTLIVTGAADPIPTSAPGAALLARSLPSAQTAVIPGAGHLPHIEQPDRFNRLVLDFFADAERESAPAGCQKGNSLLTPSGAPE